MQRRIVRMVDKQRQSTSTQIQAVLQTRGATVSARTIRRHLNETLLTRRHKKARLHFARTYLSKPQSLWENVLWTDETQVELFSKARHSAVYRKQNEAYEEKNAANSQIWWRFKDVLGLFCCLWHWVHCLWVRNHEIWRLSKDFGL